jgi:hypothetical protein
MTHPAVRWQVFASRELLLGVERKRTIPELCALLTRRFSRIDVYALQILGRSEDLAPNFGSSLRQAGAERSRGNGVGGWRAGRASRPTPIPRLTLGMTEGHCCPAGEGR